MKPEDQQAFEAWFLTQENSAELKELRLVRILMRHAFKAALTHRDAQASAINKQANKAPLTGRWHHGNGVLVSGTIRIARWDCDTNPPKEFRDEVMDWVCETLNAAIAAAEAHKGKA